MSDLMSIISVKKLAELVSLHHVVFVHTVSHVNIYHVSCYLYQVHTVGYVTIPSVLCYLCRIHTADYVNIPSVSWCLCRTHIDGLCENLFSIMLPLQDSYYWPL